MTNKPYRKIYNKRKLSVIAMKKLMSLGAVVCLSFACKQTVDTSHITEDNYLKADSALWAEFERDTEPLIEQMDAEPERFDVLYGKYLAIEEATDKRNVELAIEYAATPSGLRRVYMVRNHIDKKQMKRTLSEIPDSMQQSFYGQLINRLSCPIRLPRATSINRSGVWTSMATRSIGRAWRVRRHSYYMADWDVWGQKAARC